MELGEKIRRARLEKGMSQRQLCGQAVTRNMLSQIENGSARPSMDTLRYFAAQLDKPVSWFLDEQTVVSPNRERMEQARQAFAQGQYRQVSQVLEAYRGPDSVYDPERYLLEAVSLMQQAVQALEQQKAVYARQLLDMAWACGEKTPYFTPALRREWTLTAFQATPDKAVELAKTLPEDDRALLLRARAALDGQQYSRCAQLLEAAQNRDAGWHYLRGLAAMGQKDYALGVTHLTEAESRLPRQCAKLLETCYRELEDFKMAYFYACKQRQTDTL